MSEPLAGKYGIIDCPIREHCDWPPREWEEGDGERSIPCYQCTHNGKRNPESFAEDWLSPRLVHDGGFANRREGDFPGARLERGIYVQWRKECLPSLTLGRGVGMLRSLLWREDTEAGAFCAIGSRPGHYVVEPTQEVATAVARVLQWLGAGVGQCFLRDAYERAGMRLTWEPSEREDEDHE